MNLSTLNACVISAVTPWRRVLSCFISDCCFEHKDFAESLAAFLLALTCVSKAVHGCIRLLNI